LHIALGSPQVFAGIVFAYTEERCHFRERKALNFLQEKNLPARLGQQERPEQS
jgi:hypothetical protein